MSAANFNDAPAAVRRRMGLRLPTSLSRERLPLSARNLALDGEDVCDDTTRTLQWSAVDPGDVLGTIGAVVDR